MNEETARSYFPTTVSKGKAFPTKLKYLIMAPPKWGKTTFFSTIPNALLLAFEEGHMFVDCFKVVMTKWDASRKDRGVLEDEETGIKYCTAMEILEAMEIINPFSFVIIDTLDVASKMCSEWECAKAGIKHPSEGGEFGKGWDLYQTTPLRMFYNRIVKLGIGVAAITHVKEEWKRDKYGQEHFVRETSLPGGVQKFAHNTSDLIINGIWGRRRRGNKYRDRIISFDATNEIMAGTRARGVYIPNKYIVDCPTDAKPGAPWTQWQEFFDRNPKAGQEAEQFYLSNFRADRDDIDENEQEIAELTRSQIKQVPNSVRPVSIESGAGAIKKAK